MQKNLCLIAGFLVVVSLQAQTQTPSSAPSSGSQSVPQVLRPRAFVRRISASATLSVLGLRPLKGAQTSNITSNPTVYAIYTTDDLSQRIGWGGTIQAMITERLGVNAGFFLRRFGYKMNSDVTEGVTTHTLRDENTLGKYFDFPLLARFYTRGRHRPGPHWFFEGGTVFRRATRIRTLVDTTVTDLTTGDQTVTSSTTPAVPVKSTVNGYVIGLGLQLVDPVGVRVVPEVRFTRWRNRAFNNLSTYNDLNQLEVNFSLGF